MKTRMKNNEKSRKNSVKNIGTKTMKKIKTMNATMKIMNNSEKTMRHHWKIMKKEWQIIKKQ